ncbi:Ist1 domain-containing protein, partial [Cephalotus follicularis]
FWSGLLNTLLVWTKVSRWRKASKCKRTIKKLQLHLTIQNNRRDAVIRQSRIDIAQLLQTGHINQALDRVEQLYKDQCRLSAYDQINHFCLYLVNLSHFYNQSSTLSLPISVGEAVSTLIFAASRCGELPELHTLRLLFKERYGYKFEKVNVELLPGNLVNSQIKKDLCMNSVPDYVKNNLISEISREFTFNLEFQ